MPWKPCWQHCKRYYWMTGLGLAVVLALVGCKSFDYLTQVTEPVFPTAHDCGKCHVTLYEEWSGSPHARAWTEPRFAAATGQYQFAECLDCHAPQPYVTKETPALRAGIRHDGVTCVSCHLCDGVLVGPHEPTGKVKPHPIAVDPNYATSGALCGRCHVGTWNEWKAASDPNKETCQACHMPLVERTVTQATDRMSKLIVAMEKPVTVRRHIFTLDTGQNVTDRLVLSVTRESDKIVRLTLQNGLPHALPTGDFGLRILTVEIEARDANDQVTPIASYELLPELKSAVAPGESVTWALSVPVEALALNVRLIRRSYPDRPLQTLLERRISL